MTLHTLEHRNVAKVYWMLKALIGLMTRFAFAVGQATEVDWMLNLKSFHVCRGYRRIGQNGMADIAVVGDDSTRVANMLAVMTSKTT